MIRLSSQRPQHTGAMADGHLTLQDPIMVDQAELEGLLDKNMLEYDAAHGRMGLHEGERAVV